MSALLRIAPLLVLVSCAHAPDSLVASGQSLHLAADSYVTTARAMDGARDAHLVTPETYAAWRVFAARFQQAYPLAVDAWTIAVHTADAVARGTTEAAIEQLVAELAVWSTRVALAIAGKGGV